MATTKNKFREKPVDEVKASEAAHSKNDIEETISSTTKNKPKSPKTATTKAETKKPITESKVSLLERWNKTVRFCGLRCSRVNRT